VAFAVVVAYGFSGLVARLSGARNRVYRIRATRFCGVAFLVSSASLHPFSGLLLVERKSKGNSCTLKDTAETVAAEHGVSPRKTMPNSPAPLTGSRKKRGWTQGAKRKRDHVLSGVRLQQALQLRDIFALGIEPLIEALFRQDHGHPVVQGAAVVVVPAI
jgi:hypothetical protein